MVDTSSPYKKASFFCHSYYYDFKKKKRIYKNLLSDFPWISHTGRIFRTKATYKPFSAENDEINKHLIKIHYVYEGIFRFYVGKLENINYFSSGDVFISTYNFKIERPNEIHQPGDLGWIIFYTEKLDKKGYPILDKGHYLTKEQQKDFHYILRKHLYYPGKIWGIGELLEKIHQELYNRDYGFKERVKLYITDLLLSIIRGFKKLQGEKFGRQDDIDFLIKTIKADIGKKWTIKEMIDRTGLSKNKLYKILKIQKGIKPYNFVMNLRVDEAKKFLSSTEKSITEIGMDLGFYSSQHFAGMFKKYTGLTPSQYRTLAKQKKL